MECYAAIKECHRFVCSDMEKYLKETSHENKLENNILTTYQLCVLFKDIYLYTNRCS